jgi:hypothetical protein
MHNEDKAFREFQYREITLADHFHEMVTGSLISGKKPKAIKKVPEISGTVFIRI